MNHAYIDSFYRGALALNNAGVSLMEKRDFASAIATLKDAITVMKLSYQDPVNVNASTSMEDMSKQVNEIIAKAAKRSRSAAVSSAVGSSPVTVFIMTDDKFEAPDMVLRAIFDDSTSTEITIAVRLDISEFDMHSRNPDFDSSVILNNFAVAHVGLLKDERFAAKSSALLKPATHVLSLAYDVYTKVLCTGFGAAHYSLCLTVGALLMRNQIVVSKRLDDNKQTLVSIYNLTKIEAMMHRMEMEEGHLVGQTDGAIHAAAAA
jgi:hypothetical protein